MIYIISNISRLVPTAVILSNGREGILSDTWDVNLCLIKLLKKCCFRQ